MIRIGTAGWTYSDWAGVVYPEKRERTFQPLTYCAKYFDVIEINSTFYRPPSARMGLGWVQKTRHNQNFKFTAKLWQGFTHDRDRDHAAEESQFKEGLRPLVENNALGAVLVQFPYSFKYSSDALAYLSNLIEKFNDYPLVVEVRHASFDRDEFFDFLRKSSVGFCNVDQPVIGPSLKPSSILTSNIGYVRFHGRNYANWFAEGKDRALRYDYLYSSEELKPWIDRIKQMSHESTDLFIIQNNHFRGKGACNALELKNALTGEKVHAPAPLVRAFPDRLLPITIVT